jgi:hypothetical protein
LEAFVVNNTTNQDAMNKSIIYLAFFMLLVWSCSDSDQPVAKQELSQFAQEFLSLRMGSSSLANNSADAAINKSFQNMMGGPNRGGRTSGDSTVQDPGTKDTTIYPQPWTTCAKVTTIFNPDGSTTTINDYGTGCREGWGEYSYLMHGKLTQTYRYSTTLQNSMRTDAYLFKILYEGYGGDYGSDSTKWGLDGNSFYEGFSSYDSITKKFSGEYQYSSSAVNFYGGKSYRYSSSGKSHYDEQGWVVEESEYEYGDETENYHAKVVSPLFSNYSCNDENIAGSNARYIWVAVSGKEIVNYTKEGKKGSFEIDYGNGECDNIIFITENGNTTRVDLGDAGWFCGFKEG